MKIGVVSNSEICIPLLSYLSNNKAEVILYMGKSADAGFNIGSITGFCKAQNIPLYIEDKREELYAWQQMLEPAIIFFSGYSYKVDVSQLCGVSMGVYNIHFGKLPAYRGPSPVFWQLKNGEKELGLAIHELTDKLDAGPIVWEQNIKNEAFHTYNYLNQVFSELQVRGVAEILISIIKKQPLRRIIQKQAEARYYNRPQLADVMVNWDVKDANQILDTVKACTSWNNGASTLINGYELKILDAEIAFEKAAGIPGTITIATGKFNVACKNDMVLSINFFNINSTVIPARYAGIYGLKTGQTFKSTI